MKLLRKVLVSIALTILVLFLVTANPTIEFDDPTPGDGDTQNYDYVFINATITDAGNTSAFIDWNKSLVGWWSFENGSGWQTHSQHNITPYYFNKFGGAWCWIGDPRAIHFNNVTYVGWANRKGDVVIWSYNHSNNATTNFTLNAGFEVDDHVTPSIHKLTDGRLMAFYTKHLGSSNITYRISTNPQDISAWDAEQTTGLWGGNTAYPTPVYLSEENLTYLFYRGPSGEGWDPTYTTYNGTDWSADIKLVNYSGQRPYMKVAGNDVDEIHFAFNPGNPEVFGNNSLYYMYYNNGSFYLPNDTYITNTSGLPLYIDNVSLAYDESINNNRSWVYDIALNSSDDPFIVYAIVEDPNTQEYWYAWFNRSNNSWVNKYITDAGKYMSDGGDTEYYSGGITIDPENTSIVYLSKRLYGSTGFFNIQKATTNDKGKTWTFENITNDYGIHNYRPFVVRNHTDDFNIVWFKGYYETWTDYHTRIYSDKMLINDLNITNISGEYGDAMEFDGTYDFIAVPDNAVLEGMSELTLEAWVNIGSLSEGQKAIVAKWESSAPGSYILSYQSTTNLLEFWIGNSSNEFDSSKNLVSIEDNQWHHVVGVWNGTHMYSYLDGTKLGDVGTITGTIENTNKFFSIGAYEMTLLDVTGFFNGKIDEARIFSRALSDQEVNASYNNGAYRLYHNFTNLPDGTHNYSVHVINQSGVSNSTTVRNVTVDTTFPQVTIGQNATSILNGSGKISINWTATDTQAIDTVIFNITYPNGTVLYNSSTSTGEVNLSSPDNMTVNGTYNITLWANDTAGNENTTTSNFTLNISNDSPDMPAVSISSQNLTNTTSEYLNCSATITDPDNDTMNVTVRWYKDGSLNRTDYYNNTYANGTAFNATLGSGNTTKNQEWNCSIRLDDGTDQSGWANSTGLTILNTAPTVPTQNSPAPEANITTNYSSLDCSGSTDADNDNITYYYFGDSTDGSTSLGANDTANAYNWTGLSDDTTYFWKCLAGDGTENSSATAVRNFTTDIEDLPISVSARISPSTAYSNSTLIGYCNGTDSDNDVLTYYYLWYRDGAQNESGSSGTYANGTEINVDNLTAELQLKGENWTFACLANDGNQNATAWTNSSIIISNLAPTPPSSAISSESGTNTTTEYLNCSATISDPDNDTMNVTVRWYKNKALTLTTYHNNTYANGTAFNATIGSGNTTKGETWNCSIRLDDGTDQSGWGMSSDLTILNTAPTDPTPTISSENGTNKTNEYLNCSATITDPDGDNLNATVNWTKNGVFNRTDYYNNTYANGTAFNATLGSGNTTLDDIWKCSIRLDDGTAQSNWANSTNLTILNTGPTKPTIVWESPTPGNGSTRTVANVYLNTTINDTTNTSAFFDWDHTLIGWWRFENSSDFESHSTHDIKSIFSTSNDGAWCWFADPRAIHFNNVTYVGWANRKGDVVIWSYNHTNNQTTNYTLHASLEEDDHVNPSILIRTDGRLMAFYTSHQKNDSIYYRTSTNPQDISAWDAEQTTGPNGTYTGYPNPIYLSEENLTYLFYRGPNEEGWNPTYVIYNGTNWTNPQVFFNVTGSPPPQERPYTKVASDGIDDIHFAFTDGHPDSIENNSIYYVYYKNDSYYLPNGTYVMNTTQLPLFRKNISLVYNASITGEKAWIWDIALNGSDDPYIVYAIVENTTNHYYQYAWWNSTGNVWVNYNITNNGGGIIDSGSEAYYSGGVVLDHENVSIIYLSKEINGIFEIQKATTTNKGKSWIFTNITSNSTKDNLRPIVIRNHTSDFNIVWMYGDYIHFSDFATKVYSDKMIITTTQINSTNGKYGNSFAFDGTDDYISISDDDILEGMSELTVEAWIKKGSKNSADPDTIVVKGDAANPMVYSLDYHSNTDKIYWIVSNSSTMKSVDDAVSIEDDEWHHIVGVYNGTHIYMYLDGNNLSDTATLSGNVATDNNIVRIGNGFFPFFNGYFTGQIDEVRIFSRALTPEEINASYNNKVNRLYRMFSGLADRIYTYSAHVIDEVGNINTSGERTVEIDTSGGDGDSDGDSDGDGGSTTGGTGGTMKIINYTNETSKNFTLLTGDRIQVYFGEFFSEFIKYTTRSNDTINFTINGTIHPIKVGSSRKFDLDHDGSLDTYFKVISRLGARIDVYVEKYIVTPPQTGLGDGDEEENDTQPITNITITTEEDNTTENTSFTETTEETEPFAINYEQLGAWVLVFSALGLIAFFVYKKVFYKKASKEKEETEKKPEKEEEPEQKKKKKDIAKKEDGVFEVKEKSETHKKKKSWFDKFKRKKSHNALMNELEKSYETLSESLTKGKK